MRDTFHEIFSTLKQNKLRTALTGFSVAWGIFLLIALLGAGNGVLNALLGNTEMMDSSMNMYAQSTSKPYGGYEKNRYITFDERDVDILRDESVFEMVDDVSPMISQFDSLYVGDYYTNSYITGAYPILKDINKIELISGRFINSTDIKENRKSIVIGSTDAESILGKGRKLSELVGTWVRLGSFSYKVVGVYKSDESMGASYAMVYVPFTTLAMIYVMGNDIPRILFSFHGMETEEESEAFEDKYLRIVNNNHYAAPDDKSTVYFYNRLQSSRQMGRVVKIIRTSLWILGLLCLISGIVGISNIMLITVKERTHEFGIRKAIGAKPMSILKLIIAESIVITAFFGYIGMVLGLAANQIMDLTMSDKPIDAGIAQVTMFVNPYVGIDVAVKATILLIVAGTLAGMIPAWKASKVKPIEALRAER
ncbi:MAG: ABC transporter permease [Bacteroidales bacterium]|nr:ABC transporter permease [Bacteroidales bacterium]